MERGLGGPLIGGGLKWSGVHPPLSSSRACLSRPSSPSQFAACSTGHSIVHWLSVPIPVPPWVGQASGPGGSGLYRQSRWAIGLSLGRGFYLWFTWGLLRNACACRGGPHSATHSFTCACRDMGRGGRGGQRATGVCHCHRLLCVVLVLRIKKPQWVQALLELGHTTIQGGGGQKVGCGPTTVLQPRLPLHGLHCLLSSLRVRLD